MIYAKKDENLSIPTNVMEISEKRCVKCEISCWIATRRVYLKVLMIEKNVGIYRKVLETRRDYRPSVAEIPGPVDLWETPGVRQRRPVVDTLRQPRPPQRPCRLYSLDPILLQTNFELFSEINLYLFAISESVVFLLKFYKSYFIPHALHPLILLIHEKCQYLLRNSL